MLDSVALIDWFCGREQIEPYLRRIIRGEDDGAFSTVSEIELWQGLRPGEEHAHDAILSLMQRVPVDSAIARRAGELRRTFGLDVLSLPDAAVLASAELTGRTLLTRNTRDFGALEHVTALEFYGS